LTRAARSGGIGAVPKYDAFGREIGEETLQGLGETSKPAWERDWEQERADREAAFQSAAEAPPAPASPKAAEAAPAAPEAPPAQATSVRPDAEQRRALAAQITSALKQAEAAKRAQPQFTAPARKSAGRGCLVAMIVFISVAGLLVAGVVGLVSSVDVKSGGSGITVKPSKPDPKGFDQGSLVREANVADALTQIQSEGGKITNLRVAPERIDAQLLTPQGRLRSVEIRPGEELQRVSPDSGSGFDNTPTIPISRINPAAPQRLARAGAERLKVRVSTLQYAVPTLAANQLFWTAYFLHGRYVLGDARGRFRRAYP
jgi:hypothetical protein